VVKVQTVTGPIESAEMGLTLTHEHLFNIVTPWWHPPYDDSPRSKELVDEKVSITNVWELRHDPFLNKDNCALDDIESAIVEVKRFAAQGGRTVLEACADQGNGRDPEGLARISRESGLNVVMGSGIFLDPVHGPEHLDGTVREIADRIVRDLTVGAQGTNIRAGFIGEIFVGQPFTNRERNSLAGACLAQRETGVPIQIHMPGWYRLGDEVLDFVAAQGVPMQSVVLCHSNPSGDDYEYQTRLLKRGIYLQYDMIGMQVFYADQQAACTSDEDDARNIARLVQAGFGDRVLMSQDIFMKILLRANGGPGYGHIVEFFLPRLARHGVPLQQGIAMMTDNPRRLFEEAR
jgi:phosphotriesterase-related protein